MAAALVAMVLYVHGTWHHTTVGGVSCTNATLHTKPSKNLCVTAYSTVPDQPDKYFRFEEDMSNARTQNGKPSPHAPSTIDTIEVLEEHRVTIMAEMAESASVKNAVKLL